MLKAMVPMVPTHNTDVNGKITCDNKRKFKFNANNLTNTCKCKHMEYASGWKRGRETETAKMKFRSMNDECLGIYVYCIHCIYNGTHGM